MLVVTTFTDYDSLNNGLKLLDLKEDIRELDISDIDLSSFRYLLSKPINSFNKSEKENINPLVTNFNNNFFDNFSNIIDLCYKELFIYENQITISDCKKLLCKNKDLVTYLLKLINNKEDSFEDINDKDELKPNTELVLEDVESEQDLEDVEPEKDLEEVESELALEEIEPELDLEGLESEQDLEDVESALDLEVVEPEQDLEEIESTLDLEVVEPEQDLEDIEPEQDLEDIEPELDLEEVESALDLEGIEPELDLEGVEPELDLEGVEPELDLEEVEPELDLEEVEPELDLENKLDKDNNENSSDLLTLLNSCEQNSNDIDTIDSFKTILKQEDNLGIDLNDTEEISEYDKVKRTALQTDAVIDNDKNNLNEIEIDIEEPVEEKLDLGYNEKSEMYSENDDLDDTETDDLDFDLDKTISMNQNEKSVSLDSKETQTDLGNLLTELHTEQSGEELSTGFVNTLKDNTVNNVRAPVEEHLDLRNYLRKNPYTPIEEVLKLYSKKEVERGLMQGKILKKNGTLRSL